MARIRLDIPASLPFRTVIPIRVTDLNYGAHLGNDALLSIMHEARMQFLASHGFTELNAGGASFIMGDCAIVYKAEGFYGQSLEVFMGAGEYTRVGFDLYYRFLLLGENRELALAKTGIVTFDYQLRKVVPVPDLLREKLGDCFLVSAPGHNPEQPKQ